MATPHPPHPPSQERGQVVPLLLLVLALATAAAVIVGEVAVAAVERTRAQTAADAAALAAAADGEASAHAAAIANGAVLERYVDLGAAVEVEVRYRRARAVATAEAAMPTQPVGGGDRTGLAPVLQAALARADGVLGRPVPVVSGSGLAFEVPLAFVPTLLAVAADAGLCQPAPESDPIHFEPCPLTSPA